MKMLRGVVFGISISTTLIIVGVIVTNSSSMALSNRIHNLQLLYS